MNLAQRHALYADYLQDSRQWRAYILEDGLVLVKHGDPNEPYIRRSQPMTREEAWVVARQFIAWVRGAQ